MGKKKKLRKIVAAVSEILGDDVTKRKLKKVKAITRFKEDMNTRLDEIRAELHGGGLSPVREAMLYRHAQVLQKQISKTDRILKKLEHPEE